MKDEYARVCIIIVNYNGHNDTIECLESLEKIDYLDYKTIVVDNGSTIPLTENEKSIIKKTADLVLWPENLGFSGGNNVGIKYAQKYKPQYYLLLNNDTTVDSNFLSHLVAESKKRNDDGIFGGKILYHSNPDRIWYAGGSLDCITGKSYHTNYNCADTKFEDFVEEVTFITGCMMLIPNNILMEVGYLEEKFFLYGEDNDYCFRTLLVGKKMYYVNRAVIYHKVSASTGVQSSLTQYYMVRNGLYISKMYSKEKRRAFLFRCKTNIMSILNGSLQVKPCMKAYWDYFRNIEGK